MSYRSKTNALHKTPDCLLWIAVACLSILLLASKVAGAEETPKRYAITSAQVIDAMQAAQLPTQGAKVTIAAPVTALSSGAPLEIQSVTLASSTEIRMKMTCRNHGDCLAFFVSARFPQEVKQSSLPTVLLHQPGSATVAADQSAAAIEAKADSANATLKAGSSATLQMDGERLHIFVTVICLEGGSAGDRIRVTTRDHKQSFVAQIVTPTLLKGTL